MQKYPDEIALHTADLTGANNSILVSLSNFTTEVTANEFTLDRIYVTADKGQIEKPNPSAGSSMWTSIRTLVNSFTSDKYATGASQDSKTLTIWVNRAITHVDLLQKMVDTEFVPYYKEKTGKDIMIGFNPKFLIDALRVIDDENVTIYMVNPKAPCYIKDDEQKYVYLILPVNFNTAVN